SMDTINELFLLTQPAHLQRILGRDMDGRERAEARAKFIRGRLGAG
ncbi:MAG: ATP--guanido phosphotransferase, partial [Planctomycetota bacterium]|nr:ATP--guanido phosphotransferase [Planctomycetota bacterium]